MCWNIHDRESCMTLSKRRPFIRCGIDPVCFKIQVLADAESTSRQYINRERDILGRAVVVEVACRYVMAIGGIN